MRARDEDQTHEHHVIFAAPEEISGFIKPQC
jgi:hypothetical protein